MFVKELENKKRENMRRPQPRFLKPEFKIEKNDQLPEIILFTGQNFDGEEIRTHCNIDFVGDEKNGEKVNDAIRSIIIISGSWIIYEHAGFNGYNQNLEVGYYNSDDLKDLIAKGISSAKCVRI